MSWITQVEQLAVKFKSAENALAFKKAFESSVEKQKKAPEGKRCDSVYLILIVRKKQLLHQFYHLNKSAEIQYLIKKILYIEIQKNFY